MARPVKKKLIEDVPDYTLFECTNKNAKDKRIIVMKLEEFETIRLIDYEKKMQQECAKLMNVSRTTVQKLYNDARAKIATSLVQGLKLKIDGGDFYVERPR